MQSTYCIGLNLFTGEIKKKKKEHKEEEVKKDTKKDNKKGKKEVNYIKGFMFHSGETTIESECMHILESFH